MERYKKLRSLLEKRACFKLVCGAGNEDAEEVKRLALIYTLAGTNILDVSANVDIVNAAREGIKAAYDLENDCERTIKERPCISVSIGLRGDPHVRKAEINKVSCTKCGKCIAVCEQDAIQKDFSVNKKRCIGCGKCESVCEFDAIYFKHKKVDFKKVLPKCVEAGAELLELHAVTDDDEAVLSDWKLLNSIIGNNFLSMCLDRYLLSNVRFMERVKKAHEITKERFIVQADGVPMSGGSDNYNTTLQAIACADIVQKSNLPVMILLSGGTNSKTGELAKACGVRANGIAIGTFARKIVKDFVKKENFYSDISIIKEAVSIAENLIKQNLEALNG